MKRLIGFMMLALLIGACAPKKDDSTTISTRGGNVSRSEERQGNSVGSSSVGGIRLSGAVVSSASQEDFNSLVDKMMEMVIDAESVGYVSAQPDSETGVYVGAKVRLENNAKVTNGQGNAYASKDSQLVLSVFDRFDDPNLPPLPSMRFKLIYGYVNGNQAELEFQQVGTNGLVKNYIRLEGSMTSNMFTARMYFDVQDMWDGTGEGAAGYFDYVNIPTCDIFLCK